MTETVAAEQSHPVVPKQKNVFERFAGVLFAPAETFADIARKPDILAPLVVLLVIGYITTALVMPRYDFTSIAEAQAEAMRKQDPNVSEEQLETMARFSKAAGQVFGWLGPAFGIVFYLLIAAVLLLAVRLFGGEGDFKQAFSTSMYAWVPLTLYGIILTVVVVAKGTFDPMTAQTVVKSNPAFLVDMKEQPVLFSFLAGIDIFTIWTVILLIFGFSAVSKLSRGKVAGIVISLWIVFILIRVGFAALGAARMNG